MNTGEKHINCPNCGGPIAWIRRFDSIAVCDYCQSALIFDSEAAKVAGKMAVLPAPSGRLGRGAQGTIKGLLFEILGRVRFRFGEGAWDEFYIQSQEGGTYWLSEDPNEVLLQKAIPHKLDKEDIERLRPGSYVSLDGQSYKVLEIDQATCEGGEGQLPFLLDSQKELTYLELTSLRGGQKASIELLSDGSVHAFVGTKLQLAEIEITIPGKTPEEFDSRPKEALKAPKPPPIASITSAPQAHAVAETAQDSKLKQVESPLNQEERPNLLQFSTQRLLSVTCLNCGASSSNLKGGEETPSCQYCSSPMHLPVAQLECKGCQKPLSVYTDSSREITCPNCHGVHSFKNQTLHFHPAQKNVAAPDFHPRLQLGRRANLGGKPYLLVGRMRLKESDSEGVYYSREYLLHNPEKGYRWISEYQGVYSMDQNIEGPPTIDDPSKAPKTTTLQERTFRLLEKGRQKVDYVDGEFPWMARVGEESFYAEYRSSNLTYFVESNKKELEHSLFKHLNSQNLSYIFPPLEREKNSFTGKLAQVATKRNHTFVHLILCFIFFIISGIQIAKAAGEDLLVQTLDAQNFDKLLYTQEIELKKAPYTFLLTCEEKGGAALPLRMVLLDNGNSRVSMHEGILCTQHYNIGFDIPIEVEGLYKLVISGTKPSGTQKLKLEVKTQESDANFMVLFFLLVMIAMPILFFRFLYLLYLYGKTEKEGDF